MGCWANRNKTNPSRYRRLASALLMSTVFGTLSSAYGTMALAQSQAQHSFSIPAGPLSAALAAFGRQAGLQVTYLASVASGKTTAGYSGTSTNEAALSYLLAGSGLTYSFPNPRTVAISSFSDDDASADGTQLAPVIVDAGPLGPVVGYIAENANSGSKTNTPLIETPQSVSVVTSEQAEAQGAQSIVQALRYSSGVAAEVRGSATRYDLPYIRGFGSPLDSNQYVDGLRMLRGGGYAIPQIETYGTERVELLKGPSSTLYGGVAAGGLVNAVSKAPTPDPRGEVEVLYGSNQRKQLRFDLSGPIDEEKTLLYRLVGLGRQSETQVDNTEEERYYIAPSFTWAPTTMTSLTLNGSYQYDPEGGYYGILPTVGTLWYNSAGDIPRSFNEGDPAYDGFERNQAMIGYQFEHAFNDIWTVRHNLRYLDLSVTTEAVGTASLDSNGHTINRYALGTDETLRGITSDLQAMAQFNTGALSHTALFGFDYQYSDWSQIRDYGGAPQIDFLNPVYGIATGLSLSRITDQEQHTSQSGFYAQEQLKFNNLTLVGGGRFDHVSTNTDNALTGTSSTQSDDAFSGKVGVIYNFDFGLAPYASYSTAFLPVTGSDADGNAFSPTTAEQFEIGIKYQPTWFNGLFTLAYFDITQHDVVTYANAYTSYQTGEQRSRGIELEAKVAVTDRFNLTGAFTYTDAEIVESLAYDVGDRPIGIPDFTASLWADYTMDTGFLDGITIGGGVRYVGETVGGYDPNAYSPTATRLDVPGYTLFDASLSYDVGKAFEEANGLSAQLTVNNLLDKTYVTCMANNFCNYGNGRTIYASLKYKW